MPRLRTISEAYKEIKTQDPNTSLSAYGLRRIIKEGAIPHISTGNKCLIDMDVLTEYLTGTNTAEQLPATYSKIRQLKAVR